jgi:hypothetical protein
MLGLADSIRYSEALKASPGDLIEAVREQGFEIIVAKGATAAASRVSVREPSKNVLQKHDFRDRRVRSGRQ